MLRPWSAGSPSQINARRPLLPARIWRTRQFTEALSLPPRNHLACGGFHSSTRSHGVIHSSCFAEAGQYPSGTPPPALGGFGVANMRLGLEGRRRREAPLLVEERFDPISRHDSGY